MEETMTDIQTVLSTLRRQWRLVVVLTALVAGLAGAYTLSQRPVYTASALVLVDPSRKNLLEPEPGLSAPVADNARVESEVEMAASDTVLMRVIEDLKLVENSEFSPRLGLRDQALIFFRLRQPILPTGTEAFNQVLAALQDSVSVQRRGATFLLSVAASSYDPARAAVIANAVADSYIREQLDAKVNAVLTAQSTLDARVTDARQDITEANRAFDDYMAQNIERIESESGNSTIGSLRAQLEQLSTIETQTQNVIKQVAEQAVQRNWAVTSELLASDALRALAQQRAELTEQIAPNDSASVGSLDLQRQLAEVEAELRNTAQAEVATLQANVVSTEQQSESLRQQIREAVLQSDLSDEVVTDFYGLQQRALLARNQYQALLSRSQDLQAQASLQLPDSRIVSPALAPSSPSAPNTRINLIMGAVAGLAVGLGMAFLYDNYLGGFTNEQQIEAVLRRKLTAAVPKLKRGSPDADFPADRVSHAPLSLYAESIRRVRAALDQAPGLRARRGKGLVIMVTSSLPGEGKSTLALALARSYAAGGKRTVLIDGDLRKPSLHRLVKLQPRYGLLDFFRSGDRTLQDDIVQKDPLSSAVLLLGARRSEVPTDQIVADDGFGGLIEVARRSFDVIVVDSSPLMPVVDGLYIARLVDAAVFIVRWSSTRQQDAKTMMNSLEAALEDKPLVLVLSQKEVNNSDFQHRYGDYYVENDG